VKFLKDNPNRCQIIIADKSVPVAGCITEVPPEGWTEIPHCSCGNEKILQALKEFYTAYISACDNPGGSFETMDSLRNKYLTKTLLTRLEAHDPDYDPILRAQVCDSETIQTLEIEVDRENVYTVCYTWPDSPWQKTRIRLLIAERDNQYLIDDILSDTNIHDIPAADADFRPHAFPVLSTG
jgi:hypothetical protein